MIETIQRSGGLNGYERYAEHHPLALEDELLSAVARGIELDPKMAYTISHRTREPTRGDRFVLAPDRWGCFVIAAQTVETYLRYGLSQHEFVSAHWPPEAQG